MKKYITVFLAVVLAVMLCSCEAAPSAALVISGAEINEEIFAYYADKVSARPSDYGLKAKPSSSDIRKATIELCKKYVATNTQFRDMGTFLSAAEKTQVSQKVNNIYIRSKNHYDKIGVSKQTLTKILTCEAYEEKLFSSSYDKGTGNAEGEKKLTDYFYNNYVSFRTVCAYFTSADGKSKMAQQDKNNLLADMNELVSLGTTIDAFVSAAQSKNYSVSDSLIIKKNSDGYPDGFFDSVFSMKPDTVKIIEYDECVFVVFKEDLKSKGEGVYANYRSACINDLYSDDYDKKLNDFISTLSVDEKSGVTNRIVAMVKG